MGSRNLGLAQLSFAAAYTSEWAFATGLAVVAFDEGGATAVGVVGLVRMLPSAFVTPFASGLADRIPRERAVAAIGALRALALGAAAALLAADSPILGVYALAVVATTVFTAFRPAHSALLPSLCRTPSELTSANVARTALDAGTILAGPLLAAALFALDGGEAVFAAAAVLSLASTLFVLPIRYEAPPRISLGRRPHPIRDVRDGVRAILGDAHARLIVGMAMVQTFTRGALQVFTVIVALELLETGDAGVGLLTAAVGAGGVLSVTAVPRLVAGGRLALLFGLGVALWGAPLMLLAATSSELVAILLLAVVGIGKLFVDVGMFTLLARLVPDEVLARVFGILESLIALSVGLGSLAVPLAIDLLGTRGALVAVGALSPVAFVLTIRRLNRLDRTMGLQDKRIAFLRRVPLLHPLPAPTIEFLARHARPAEIPGGTTVFEQGEPGREFFVIAGGEAEVIGDGQHIRTLGGGDCFGEIALMQRVPRTTTIRASTDLRVYRLDRDVFVPAVSGYSASAAELDQVVAGRLAAFAPQGAAI